MTDLRCTTEARVAYRYSQQPQNINFIVNVVCSQWRKYISFAFLVYGQSRHTLLAMGNSNQILMLAKAASKTKMY